MRISKLGSLQAGTIAWVLLTAASPGFCTTNLALGKTAIASSIENDDLKASQAVDGNIATRWSSTFADLSSITVDLGTAQTFNKVVLNWETAYGEAYQIQTSNDNATWNTIYTQSAGVGGTEELIIPSATARYIRMNGTARGTAWGYSLYEFEVYNTTTNQYTITASAGANGSISPSGAVTVNQGASQTFAITPAAGYVVSGVLADGANVGAVASYTFNQVQAAHTISATFRAIPVGHDLARGKAASVIYSVDLGASRGFNQVILRWGIDPLRTYQIQASDDNATWRTIYSQTTGAGGTEELTFPSTSGCYIRMIGTATGGYSLSGFEVYNTITTQHTITASAGAGGTISPSGEVYVFQGDSQTYAITPAAGNSIATLMVDGVSVDTDMNYTFTNVHAAHTIAATFVSNGQVVWSDEFSGPTLDTRKWTFDIGTGPNNNGWGNGQWEYDTSSKDNVYIEDGHLVLNLKADAIGGKPFTSVRMGTRSKYSFNHGRFVARIKMPRGNMVWPAFWLLGDHSDSWPNCGEIDIAEMFCGNVGRGDNTVLATAHWWNEGSGSGYYSSFGQDFTNAAPLSDDFHEYELCWDSEFLRGKIDGQEYWTMDITAPSLSELRNNYFYMILDVAAGAPGWKMTSPSQLDGPLPQKMIVDWIRVYPADEYSILDKVAMQPQGPFAIMADGTPTNSQLTNGEDSNLWLWNNLAPIPAAPFAGESSLALKTITYDWFGLGFASTVRKNMLNYAAGNLNFKLKTASNTHFKIGISGGDLGESWVKFTNGADPHGFVRNGQWHSISIPMTTFSSTDFSDINQFFMLASEGAAVPDEIIEVDEIIWTPNDAANRVVPTGTKFGIFTDSPCDAGVYDPAIDGGGIYRWNKDNLMTIPGTPAEGPNSYAFTAAAPWYGLGFAPGKLYDLSAFAHGHLHISLKTRSTETFKIGIKSTGGRTVRESWIKFINGSDPAPFVRDGNYHELVIPASEFCNSDFNAITQLLMISGDNGPMQMEFDNVYWTTY